MTYYYIYGGIVLDSLVSYSKQVILKALENHDKVVSMFSGGKDSLVMTKLVIDVCRENGLNQPLFIISDPVPLRENEEYLKSVIGKLGIEHYIYYYRIIKPEHWVKASPIGVDKRNCCYWLKIAPLNDYIHEHSIQAVLVAIRWDEHPERAKETFFSPRENPRHTRVHPLLHWTWLDVWEYIKQEKLPFNPLYLKGYTSLGCSPCTSKVKQDGFRDVDDIINYIKTTDIPERAGRDIDKEKIMERLRKLGYF